MQKWQLMKNNIRQLVDFEKMNALLEGFYKTTGLVAAILDLDGNVLSQSGWRQMCKEFHRINPETLKKCTISDTELANKMGEGKKYHFYKCLNGLIDVAVPIVIDGEHVANLIAGQFFFEKPNISFFKKQAEKYGFDEDKYLAALKKAPVFSEEKVRTAIDFLLDMTMLISETTLQQQKQAELNRRISESEEKYHAMYNNTPLSYQSLDENGCFIDINPMWLKTLGYEREEVIGKWYGDFLHPDYVDHFRINFPAFKKSGCVSDVQFKLRRKDNTYIYVSFEGCIGYTPEGKFRQTYCVFKDITEQKALENAIIKAKEKAEESEEKFKAIVENGSVLLTLTDAQGRVEFVSPQCEKVIGWKEEDIIGVTMPDFVHPDDKQRVAAEREKASRLRPIKDFEYRIFDKENKIRWISHSASLIRKGNAFSILSTITNITERKQSEQEIIKAKEKAEESERRFRNVIENSPIPIGVAGVDGAMIFLNKQFIKTYGYTMQDIPQVEKWYERAYPDEHYRNATLKEWKNEVEQSINEGRPTKVKEYKVSCKNGEVKAVEISAYFENEIIIGLFQDITERKKAEKSLSLSESRYRKAQKIAHVGNWEYNIQTELFWGSDEAKCIYGFNLISENFTPEEVESCIPDREIVHQALIDLIEKGKPYDLEFKIITKDKGEPRFIHSQAILEKDENGNPLKVSGVIHDITNRKLIEKSLIKSEERFQLAMRASNDGMFDWNLETNEIYYSPSWKKMLGYEDHELPNDFSVWETTTAPEDVEKSWKLQQKLITKEIDRFVIEFKMKHKEGHWVDILSRAEAFFDEQGKAIRIVGTHTDISEIKRLSKALEKRIFALTQPMDSNVEIGFDELFNIADIQRLQDEFSSATNVASIITQPDGTPITKPSNFTELCNDIIRKTEIGCANCFKSDAALGLPNTEGPTVKTCLSGGLWDAGAAIHVGNRHIANWMIGQVRDEEQNELKIREYAKLIGANENEAAAAFQKVPSMSRKQFEKVSNAMYSLANIISNTAYQNIQQARFIAERKQSEEKLHKLSQAVEQSPASVVITNLKGDIEYVNQKFTDVTGYTINEVIGHNPRILKSGEQKNEFYKELWETISSGEEWDGELQNKKKNGELYWEHARISPILNNNGEITNYLAVKENITDLKQAEKNFRHSIDQSPLGIRIVTQKGETVYANPAFLNMFDFNSFDEYISTPTKERYSIESYKEHKERKKIRKDGKDIANYEISIKQRNGKIKHIKVWRKDVIWNRTKHIQVINQDITEQKNLYAELLIAKEKAEESDRLKSSFLANMSHEIRTPMNGILGFLDLLQEPDLEDETKNTYIDIMSKSGQRLLNTINNIIEISKIDAQQVQISKHRFCMVSLLNELSDFFQAEAKAKGIKLQTQLPEQTIELISDRTIFESIFTNLIKNAIKFTPTGEIKVGLLQNNNHLTAFVSDTGVGISPEKVEKLFQRFIQGESNLTRRFEGSGLGLSITKEYVNLLNGKIWVESEVNKGSIFYVEFPTQELSNQLYT